MSKKHKKRTKRYSGDDAKRAVATTSDEPVIHRFEAVERGRVGEWWQGKKKLARVGAIVLGVAGGSIWLLTELFRVVF
jgi:hypothetical protein